MASAKKHEPVNDAPARVQVKAPPKPRTSGDQIDLGALSGKLIACAVINRYEVETKFGPRQLNQVLIGAPGSEEPLEGVIFASYFQGLDQNVWYLGRIDKTARGAWYLAPPSAKDAVAGRKLIDSLPALEAVDSDAILF